MRDVYRIPQTRAVVLTGPCEIAGCWFVQSIYVPPMLRQKGYGSELLRQVCTDADAEGLTLALAVIPQGGRRSLDFDGLVEWYGKHGFVRGEDNIMERRPRTGGNDEGLDLRRKLRRDGRVKNRTGENIRHPDLEDRDVHVRMRKLQVQPRAEDVQAPRSVSRRRTDRAKRTGRARDGSR